MDRIEQLRAFVRLVECKSFTAVANELHVKQSTVSKWLTTIESDLGVQLIDRTTRSQRVTDAGQRFYQKAQEVLTVYDNAIADLSENTSIVRGRIRMSLPVVFGQRFVTPLIAEFLHTHNELELELVFTDHYTRLVEEGFDLAIRIGTPVDSTLMSHSLGESGRRLVASPAYLQVHGQPGNPRDLNAHQCLAHTSLGAMTPWLLTKARKIHRVSMRGRIATNNSEATLAFAKNGLGICLLASWLVDPEIEAGHLIQILNDYQVPKAPIRALTSPGRHLAPRVRILIEFLRKGLAPVLDVPTS